MPDPVVHITAGIPDGGTGNITTLGQTLLDGANITIGAQSDVATVAGATGSLSAKLRAISRDIASGVILQAGANTIGAVTQAGTWSVRNLDGSGNALTSVLRGAQQALSIQIVDASGNQVTSFGSGTLPSFGSAFPTTGQAIGAKDSSGLNMQPLNLDASGNLKTVVGNASLTVAGTVTSNQGTGGASAWLVTGTGGTFPVTGTFWQATQPVSIAATVAVSATQTGTWTVQPGNTANTTPWLSTINQGGNSAAVKAASTGAAAADPSLVVNVSPNSPPMAMTQSGTWTVQRIQSAANTNLTQTRVVAAATTNATSLKASAGNIAAIDLFNVASYMVFLKLYNKASAPTVGTDTPVWTIPIPASGGFSIDFSQGEYFSTGIAFAITKLQADGDTTALVAGDVTGRIKWV